MLVPPDFDHYSISDPFDLRQMPACEAGLLYDLRQWVPLSDARLIYEARRGRCAEVEGDDPGGEGLIRSIWDVAFDKREGLPPSWCWLWRQPT